MAFRGKSMMTWKEFCRAKDNEYDEIMEDRNKDKTEAKIEFENANVFKGKIEKDKIN